MWRFNIYPAPPPAEAHAAAHTSPSHINHPHEPHVNPFSNDHRDQPASQPLAIRHTVPTGPPTAPPTIYEPTTQTPSRACTTACATTRATPTQSTEYHRRAYELPSTKNLIDYLHYTVGLPIKSAFLRAVKAGNFCSFPGLSADNVARYCPTNATPTVLGHLTQVRKGLRSTQWVTAANALIVANASDNLLPSTELFDALTAPTDTLIFREVNLATLFTDNLGRFPIRAMSSNQYIVLAYHDAANVILVQPFQSKADHHCIPAYNAFMKRLKARGIKVDLQVLDNEASVAYIQSITEVWKCKHQKVPPDMHRRNKAKQAIRTFKSHFISILAGVDPSFPKNRWDLLLPQAEITVNLLQQPLLQPDISA